MQYFITGFAGWKNYIQTFCCVDQICFKKCQLFKTACNSVLCLISMGGAVCCAFYLERQGEPGGGVESLKDLEREKGREAEGQPYPMVKRESFFYYRIFISLQGSNLCANESFIKASNFKVNLWNQEIKDSGTNARDWEQLPSSLENF